MSSAAVGRLVIAPGVPRLTVRQFEQLPPVFQELLAALGDECTLEALAGDAKSHGRAAVRLGAVTLAAFSWLERLYDLTPVAPIRRRRRWFNWRSAA